jgi:pantoate--beta-alanine ligase
MELLETIEQMREWTILHSDRPRAAVYTMGALHDGHLELVRQAKHYVSAHTGEQPYVVASIFVNPTQFNNPDDLAKYPRTLEHDLEMLSSVGVDVVFVPFADQMYPEGITNTITVEPGDLGDVLEGNGRPGHFRGVLTVVNKLFNITAPQYAMFGEKDYQQLTLISLMAAELNMPIEVVGVPTVRDSDGLALSSRNRRLNENARAIASRIPAALASVRNDVAQGYPVEEALNRATQFLAEASEISLQYLVVTGTEMQDAPQHGRARVLVAAEIDGVRLIDNMAIEIKGA